MFPVLCKGDICDIVECWEKLSGHVDWNIGKIKMLYTHSGLSKGCACNISGKVKGIKLKHAVNVEENSWLTFVDTHGCNMMGIRITSAL